MAVSNGLPNAKKSASAERFEVVVNDLGSSLKVASRPLFCFSRAAKPFGRTAWQPDTPPACPNRSIIGGEIGCLRQSQ